MEEILKLLNGAGPALQYIGGLIAIIVGTRLAFKGSSDAKTAPIAPPTTPAPPTEVELPAWFERKFDALCEDVKRIKWVLEDLRNQTGTGIHKD